MERSLRNLNCPAESAWVQGNAKGQRRHWRMRTSQFENCQRPIPDPADFIPDTRQPVYLLTGPFSEFHRLVTQHHIAMESALDPTGAQGTPPVDVYALVDGE